MAAPALRRFWRIYRDSYAQERTRRQAEERARVVSTAEAAFGLTLGLLVLLNFLATVVDLGAAWTALRYVVGVAWLGSGAWYLTEILSRRMARRARE